MLIIRFLVAASLAIVTQALLPCPSTSNGDETFTIRINHQQLTNLNRTLFELTYDCNTIAENVTTVDLSYSKIQQVDSDTFGIFFNLIHLNLSNNEISNLHVHTFHGLRTLKTLDMSFNQLTQLQAGLIRIVSLVSVWFNNNNITYVEPGIVGSDNEALDYFNMDYNALNYLDPWPYFTYQTHARYVIRDFYIRHNNISTFTNNVNWTYDLVYRYELVLHLQGNAIETLDSPMITQYDTSLKGDEVFALFLTLDMNVTNNPYHCDCKLHQFASMLRNSLFRYTRVEEFRYVCASPSRLAGIDWLHDVDMSELVCSVPDDCPANCLCEDRPHNDTFLINCTGAGLTEFPDVIPVNNRSKIELFLDHNSIKELKQTDYLDRVYNISLSYNEIETLPSDVIETLDAAKLDFSNNKIRSLPTSIKKFGYDSVNLHGNPLWCDCESLWLQDWLKTVDIGVVDTGLTCDSEEGSQVIVKMTLRGLGCTNEVLIVVVTLAVAAVIALVIAIIFAKRCPYETKVIINKITFGFCHPRDKYISNDETEKKEVDVYLVFDDHDEDVVGWIRYFTKKINSNKNKFSILNPARFMEPGSPYLTIPKWIGKSKVVLVVLSEGIFHNKFRNVEIDDAERRIIEAASEQPELTGDVSDNGSDIVDENDAEINTGDDDNNLKNAPKVVYIKYNSSHDKTRHNDDDKMQLSVADFNAMQDEDQKWQEKLNEEPWKSRLANKRVLSPDEKIFMSKIRYELPSKGTGSGEDGNFVAPAMQDVEYEAENHSVCDEHNDAFRGFQLEVDNERPCNSAIGKNTHPNLTGKHNKGNDAPPFRNKKCVNPPFKNHETVVPPFKHNGHAVPPFKNNGHAVPPFKNNESSQKCKNKKSDLREKLNNSNISNRINFISAGNDSPLSNIASNISNTLKKERKVTPPSDTQNSHLQYSRAMNNGVILGKDGMMSCDEHVSTNKPEPRCSSAASSVASSALFSEC